MMTSEADEKTAHVSPTGSGDMDDDVALAEHLMTKQAAEHQLVCSPLA